MLVKDVFVFVINVFVRECRLNGIGSDGSPCADESEMTSIPFIITDQVYENSRLFDY